MDPALFAKLSVSGPSKKRAFLDRLPQEIFDKIIFNVKNRACLSSLSRTCKKLRALINPLVYQDITMLFTGPVPNKTAKQRAEAFRKKNTNVTYMQIPGLPKLETPRLDLLLLSIIQNPDLRRYVRKIDLRCVQYRSKSGWPHKPKLPPPTETRKHLDMVDKLMRSTKLDKTTAARKLQNGLERWDIHAAVCMLILLCPDITSLTLGLEFLAGNQLLDFVFRGDMSRITLPTPLFQNLEQIRLGVSFEEEKGALVVMPAPYFLNSTETDVNAYYATPGTPPILPLDAYLVLFHCPKLKKAEVSLPRREGWPDREIIRWSETGPPQSSVMQDLRIPTANISPHQLLHILEHTPFVTRLEYQYNSDEMFGNFALRADHLLTALTFIKGTLKHLKFEIQYWERYGPVAGLDAGLIEWVHSSCPLTDLTNLETVTISPSVILGWNFNKKKLPWALPPSLVSLCLTDDLAVVWPRFQEEDLKHILQSFVDNEKWRGFTPRLEEVNLTFDLIGKKEMVSFFEKNGLKCRMLPPVQGWSCEMDGPFTRKLD